MTRVTLFRLLAGAALALGVLAACPADTTRIRLRNESGLALDPYSVVDGQRVPDAATLAPGGTYGIDPQGFNPAFYRPGPVAAGAPNGLVVQMALDSFPGQVLTRVLHYPVPPDQVVPGSANEPVVVDDVFAEVQQSPAQVEVVVGPGFAVTIDVQ